MTTAAPERGVPRDRFRLMIVGCWLLAAAMMLLFNRHGIAGLDYPDPDDQLRLVEVRDLLAGQSWWDVSQHRMNPPIGGPMHWSRLVDLPIAGIELLFRALAGTATAQTIAAVAVPLATLGCAMAMVAALTRRLIEREAAVIAALLVAASPAALQQMQPLRVDHHGWQIALAVAITLALLDERRRRSGLIAGALTALWLRISLEGLPFAAAAATLVGLRWAVARDRGEDARLIAFFGALGIGSALLFAALIPPAEWRLAWCDSMSSAQLAMLAIAAIGAPLIARAPARRPARLLAGAGLALAGLAAFHLAAPRCGLDAFGDLSPLSRAVWFDNVLEGQPLWRQGAMTVALALGYPLVGLLGAGLAWRAAAGERRTAWTGYAFLLAATIAAAVLVQRVGSTANMLALPGGTWLLFTALRRARRLSGALARAPATAAALLLFAPPTPALAARALLPEAADKAPAATGTAAGACATTRNLRLLDWVPPARILAPLDLGPGILLETRHSVVAGSYHRNSAGIDEVIRAYTGPPGGARAIMRAHGLRYVALCRAAAETDVYRRYAPRGFAAALAAGRVPAWLTPVPIGNSGGLRLWRLADPPVLASKPPRG